MSWKTIIKRQPARNISDFQLFLSDVFNISRVYSRNLEASKGLKQAISNGLFLNYITEEDFGRLMNLAQEKKYDELVEFLEEIFGRYVGERTKLYQQSPESKERRKQYSQQYTQKPENKDIKSKYDKERYRRLRGR